MCVTCGCGQEEVHAHPHTTDLLAIEERVLAHNDHLAAHNRAWLERRGIRAVNLMSSPGSGKTSLLERTIAETSGRREVCVIEGDQETAADAERIARAGARAVQVNTGAGCHLDAVDGASGRSARWTRGDGSLLFVENVGNLVCPALFDVGEHRARGRGLRDRGRRQAAEVPADVRGRRPGGGEQDRPAAVRRLRPRRGRPRTPAPSTRASTCSRCPCATASGMDAWYAWLDRISP